MAILCVGAKMRDYTDTKPYPFDDPANERADFQINRRTIRHPVMIAHCRRCDFELRRFMPDVEATIECRSWNGSSEVRIMGLCGYFDPTFLWHFCQDGGAGRLELVGLEPGEPET